MNLMQILGKQAADDFRGVTPLNSNDPSSTDQQVIRNFSRTQGGAGSLWRWPPSPEELDANRQADEASARQSMQYQLQPIMASARLRADESGRADDADRTPNLSPARRPLNTSVVRENDHTIGARARDLWHNLRLRKRGEEPARASMPGLYPHGGVELSETSGDYSPRTSSFAQGSLPEDRPKVPEPEPAPPVYPRAKFDPFKSFEDFVYNVRQSNAPRDLAIAGGLGLGAYGAYKAYQHFRKPKHTPASLGKQAAAVRGTDSARLKPGTSHLRGLLSSLASNRQSAWRYGVKVVPKEEKSHVLADPTGPTEERVAPAAPTA